MMQKFNDSSLVSACLNFSPTDRQRKRQEPGLINYAHKQLDDHFDSLKKEMYLSQYQHDFRAPEKDSSPKSASRPAAIKTAYPVSNGCKCPKCLG